MTDVPPTPALVLSATQVAGSSILGFRQCELAAVDPDGRADIPGYRILRPWISGDGDHVAIDLLSIEEGGLLDEVLLSPLTDVRRTASAADALRQLALAHPIAPPDRAVIEAATGDAVTASGSGLEIVAWSGGMAFGAEPPLADLLAMLPATFLYEEVRAVVGGSVARLKQAVHLLPDEVRTTYVPHWHALNAAMQRDEGRSEGRE